MFNGQFDHTRFGLSKVLPNIEIQVTFTESLDNLSGFGEDIPASFNGHVSLEGSSMVSTGFMTDLEATTTLLSSVKVTNCIRVDHEFIDAMEGNAYLGELMSISFDQESTLLVDAYLSSNIYTNLMAHCTWDQFSSLFKNLSIQGALTSNLICDIDASVLETETLVIQVAIPPGGELRIDSDFFTATLNGQNILHLHQGDWINIDRNLVDIKINTGDGGALSGRLVYKERYL